MGLGRYFLHDWFTAEEFNRIDKELETVEDFRLTLSHRVRNLEKDLAVASLLVHSLAEACIRKGALTREEILLIGKELDLVDGVVDGKMGPPRKVKVKILCAGCRQQNPGHIRYCLYCGKRLPQPKAGPEKPSSND